MSTSGTKKVRLSPPLKNCFYELLMIFFSECLRAKYWCSWSSKSMSEANALSMLLILFLLLKRHERSECHSPWFCPWFSFYSFNKLLKAFRHPPRPSIARLSDFKKLLLSDIKLQMADKMDFKNYFCRTLKLLLSDIKLQSRICSLMLKNYKNRSQKLSNNVLFSTKSHL